MPSNIIHNDKDTVFFIGDVHGFFSSIRPWVIQYGLKDCIIIFCGDFGLGFEKLNTELRELSKSDIECDKRNIDCYIIRGNHDDPEYYNGPDKLNLRRFKTVSDYTTIITPSHQILCVGGAVSVDRLSRQVQYEYECEKLSKRMSPNSVKKKVKLYWWPNENFKFDASAIDSLIEQGVNIDTVATHTAPDFCFPGSKGHYWARIDPELEHDLVEERSDVTKLYGYLQDKGMTINNWFYGHFHAKKVEIVNGTKFVLLDMGRHSKGGEGVGGVFDMAELH